LGGSFQRYTVRGFQIGPRPGRENLLSSMRSSPDLYRTPGKYDPVSENYDRDVSFRNAGDFINAYGYDIYGNEIGDGFDGPKHPVFGDFYLMDKIELSDLVVNAGLRLDIIDSDDRQFRDFIDYDGVYGQPGTHYSAANPLQRRSNEIIPAGMEKKPAFKQISPRLGFSFPVSDRTQFHVQYGKFLQAPQLSTLYAGRGISAVAFSGQYFVPSPIGYGLDPERTTQYEIGFTQQFSDYAVFDITGFYKDIQGQIQYAQINTEPGSVAAAYPTLQNGDYATTKGLEFRLSLRRVSRVQAQVNYTLADAQGTGSSPYSSVAGVAVGTPRPTVISPLEFNQTHRGTVNVDYRFGENDGGSILSRLGANLLLTFNSGHNFTRAYGSLGQRGAYLGGILADDDPRARKPLEPINASTTPWFYNIDLRIDKSIQVGALDLNVYFYVQNLLNTKNVINVYGRTGNAYDDGFLGNPDLSGPIVSSRGQQYIDLYKAINLGNRQHYALTQGGDLFGPPRQIRLGFKLEY
ncbi:MAG: TonB-dependent receptor, partial [Ignavibacteria bacterium]|nr:TonB-dependent receptor [Ignavibacteria bacterium]